MNFRMLQMDNLALENVDEEAPRYVRRLMKILKFN